MTALFLNNTATDHLQKELAYLRLPAANWSAPRQGPDSKDMPDVAIIGAGMFGIAAAVTLRLKGIHNIRIFDASDSGREGPWTTYARMPTLRSPKELPGVALGIEALTFRAWHEATYGAEAFQALYKIPNALWQDYLNWIKQALALPVENNHRITGFVPATDFVRLDHADGTVSYARRLVVATGRNGAGGANIPAFVDPALWPHKAAHSCDTVDFAALKGKKVAVIGAGASAWDNAATALEHGAAKVTMYARRKSLPQINKGRAYAFPGFFEGWYGLSPAQKWETSIYLDDLQPPPPHETIHRTLAAGERFELRLGASLQSVSASGDEVVVRHAGGTDTADFLIVGTGFRVDLSQDALFAAIADYVALWKDRYQPPAGQERGHLGLYPWLGAGFELEAKEAGETASGLNRVHLFNHAASLSFGALASDIPGISTAAERLSSRMVEHIFREDYQRHLQNLKDWQVEWELETTPFLVR